MADVSDWLDYVMTVGELREKLKDLPDDLPIIMEKDAEGNGHSPLSGVWEDYRYHPDSSWSGEVTDGDYCCDDDDNVIPDCPHETCRHSTGTDVLLLGPVN